MSNYIAKFELNLDKKENRILHLEDINKEYKFFVENNENPLNIVKEYLKTYLGDEYILKNLYKLENISFEDKKNKLKLREIKSKTNNLEKLVS